MLKPNPQCDCICWEVVTGYEAGTLMNGNIAFIKETTMRGHKKQMPLSRHQIYWRLDLAFSSLQNCENPCLSHPICQMFVRAALFGYDQ